MDPSGIIFLLIIGIFVVIIVAVYLNKKEEDTRNIPHYPRPSQSTHLGPSFVTIYQRHFPRIQKTISDFFTQNHVKRDVDTEIKCFMYFLSVILSTPAHLSYSAELFLEIAKEVPEEEINKRYKVYVSIFCDGMPARADWARAPDRYDFARHEQPLVRVMTAFGDYLINKHCADDYFEALPVDFSTYFMTLGFDNFLNNEIFLEIVKYSREFPSPIHYQGE